MEDPDLDHNLGLDLDLDAELDLPPLSQSAITAAQTPPRPFPLLTRKRTHADYEDDPGTSSDPALFSSDEQAPGAENYVAGRRKKRTYKGSWWDRHPLKEGVRRTSRKREFTRNFDSGIFMGSEGSEEQLSSDSFAMEEELLRDQQVDRGTDRRPQSFRRWSSQIGNDTPRAKLVTKLAVVVPKEHEEVCAIVRACLDKGKEDVDLCSMSLSSLPAEITSLKTLSKQDEIVPGMLDTGTDLEPHLRLYLANNLFTRFPTPVLDLRNLRVLSLRHNNLTAIPPAIRELVHLESLNVAGNQLTELPFEVVELMRFHRLRELVTSPNPWSQPEDFVASRDIGVGILRAVHDGAVLCRSFSTQSRPEPMTQQMNQNLRVPSLTEVVLRQLAQLDPQAKLDFRELMPPQTSESVLDQLRVLTELPGRRCTQCQRPIVLAGEQRIEWWSLDNGTVLPYRRFQCWAGCDGPDGRTPGTECSHT